MTPSRLKRTLFFDLDGTLTNPAKGIYACIRHALSALGQPAPDDETLRSFVGPPLHGSFGNLLGSDELADQALELYRQRFTTIGLFENAVYDGIPETLDALAQNGFQLFVVTSKPKVYADRIMDHFDLSAYFGEVFGPALQDLEADKARLLQGALDKTGTAPNTAVMIGDRKQDIAAGKRLSVASVGVLYGFGSAEELSEADIHVKTPTDLVGTLTNVG